MQRMNKRISDAIDLLRFPLIVGVVLIHAYSTQVPMTGGQILGADSGYTNAFTQNLISQVFARIAVPMFFLISGYFLFGQKELTFGLIKEKWKKRIHSLFIPYLIWNFLVLLVQIIGQSTPKIERFFSGRKWNIGTMTPMDYLDALIGFSNGPINFPLWFIRDLMLLVILSPLLYLLINRSKGTILALLSLLWIGVFNVNLFVSSEALLFFSVGLFLAQIKSIFLPSRKVTWILCIFYLMLSLLEAHSLSTQNSMPLLHEFNILLGCVAVFAFSINIDGAGRMASLLRSLAASSFFLYVAHGSLLQIFKKISYVLLDPHDDLLFIGIYFFAPAATIALLVAVYFGVLRFLPMAIQEVLLGSRKPKHNKAMEATAYSRASS